MGKICGVYLIISPIGRRYVGSSIDVVKRWGRYRRLDCQSQILLYRSLKKYGPSLHEYRVIYRCNEEERLIWERIFGDLYLSLFDFGGLNNSLPGYEEKPQVLSEMMKCKISDTLREHFKNPENRKKLSDRRLKYIKENPEKIKESQEKSKVSLRKPEYRTKRSVIAKEIANRPEIRKLQSESVKKRFEDPEERRTQSERTKRHMNLPESIERNRNAGIKRFESIEKMVEARERAILVHINNPSIAKEHSERMKKHYNGGSPVNAKSVINKCTGEVFGSIKKAADSVGMKQSTLALILSGVTKTNNTAFLYKITDNATSDK